MDIEQHALDTSGQPMVAVAVVISIRTVPACLRYTGFEESSFRAMGEFKGTDCRPLSRQQHEQWQQMEAEDKNER